MHQCVFLFVFSLRKRTKEAGQSFVPVVGLDTEKPFKLLYFLLTENGKRLQG